MKKLIVLILALVFILPLSGAAFTNPTNSKVASTVPVKTDLSGVWTGVEIYPGYGRFPSQWTFTPAMVACVYKVEAVRTSTGDTVQELAILVPSSDTGVLAHHCYGDGCGNCGYVFVGTVSDDTFRGAVEYICRDGSYLTGAFRATRGTTYLPDTYGGSDPTP